MRVPSSLFRAAPDRWCWPFWSLGALGNSWALSASWNALKSSLLSVGSLELWSVDPSSSEALAKSGPPNERRLVCVLDKSESNSTTESRFLVVDEVDNIPRASSSARAVAECGSVKSLPPRSLDQRQPLSATKFLIQRVDVPQQTARRTGPRHGRKQAQASRQDLPLSFTHQCCSLSSSATTFEHLILLRYVP